MISWRSARGRPTADAQQTTKAKTGIAYKVGRLVGRNKTLSAILFVALTFWLSFGINLKHKDPVRPATAVVSNNVMNAVPVTKTGMSKHGESAHSTVHTTNDQASAGASAKCRDGTYSYSHSHRGACSRHGGVASWLN